MIKIKSIAQSSRNKDLSRLAPGIAHELNTPMQFLGDNLSFLGKGRDRLGQYLNACEELLTEERLQSLTPEDLQTLAELKKKLKVERMLTRMVDAVQDSQDGVERISSIVKAMKEYALPENEKKTSCNLNNIVNTALTVGRTDWKYVAKAEVKLDQDLLEIEAFPRELTQAVLNIVVNASSSLSSLKDQKEKTAIISVVSANLPEDEAVTLQISDNGPGFPDELKSQVLDMSIASEESDECPYQRLAVSREIIENRHGGRVKLETGPERGTTVIVTLPVKNKTA